jgi:hypothetical protein
LASSKLKKCYNCKKEVNQWVTVVDMDDYPTSYEDCRAPDKFLCLVCLKDNIEKVMGGVEGNICDMVFYHDIRWKLYPDVWKKFDRKN